jgi:hypothetical protein
MRILLNIYRFLDLSNEQNLLIHNENILLNGFSMSQKACIKMLIVVNPHFPDATP